MHIVCDRILMPDGTLRAGRVSIDGGRIAAVDADGPALSPSGPTLLPGLVDLHGDGIERHIMPRPGVEFPLDLALLDVDRHLAANGATTPFLSLTCSWETGLRSAAMFGRVLKTLEPLRERLCVDHKIHLRFETMALDAVDDAKDWIESGQIDLVSINDHFAMDYADREDPGAVAVLAKRSGVAPETYRRRLESLAERRSEAREAVARILEAARRANVPAASHDDRDAADRRAMRALGCRIADFPTTEDAMREARRAGEPVILGAPNVVRGGSHKSRGVSAARMVEEGLCTALASDYYSPALPAAAVRLWREHGVAFGAAWGLISSAPAEAAGLADRGRIAPGLRADLVLVDIPNAAGPPVECLATVADGHVIVHRAPHIPLSKFYDITS